MHKTLAATALIAALPFAGIAHAGDGTEESPFSANVGIVSDYAYRGISQTDERPALQGGFDYTHSSGFYAGVWATNVSWINDAEVSKSSGNSLEIDVYAGYAGEAGPIGYDVGLLQYYYPGSYGSVWKAETGMTKPNTLEGYVGLSWEFLSFKYSYAFTDLFGLRDSDGSQYYDLGAEFELGAGFKLDLHYGYNDLKGGDDYEDWKLGVTKEFGGFDFGLHYVDSDIKHSDLADERFILSVSKSF